MSEKERLYWLKIAHKYAQAYAGFLETKRTRQKYTSGIYGIKCLVNNKIYVGSSVEVERRWKVHQNRLRQNFHWNPHLQAAWNKYGEESFEWTILEILPRDTLVDGEAKWFGITNCCNAEFGFNIAIDPQSCTRGRPRSPETKHRIKMALTGRRAPESAISNMRNAQHEANKGEHNPKAKLTEETVKAIREDFRKSRIAQPNGTRPTLAAVFDELMHKYGIRKAHLEKIVYRHSWRHI